jgi:leucine-zipper of insertion element IS481
LTRRLEGEKLAPFGISRKTGYKIFDRYKDCGVAAFTDRSRRPYRQANRLQSEFMLGNRRYCSPLTITGFASR